MVSLGRRVPSEHAPVRDGVADVQFIYGGGPRARCCRHHSSSSAVQRLIDEGCAVIDLVVVFDCDEPMVREAQREALCLASHLRPIAKLRKASQLK